MMQTIMVRKLVRIMLPPARETMLSPRTRPRPVRLVMPMILPTTAQAIPTPTLCRAPDSIARIKVAQVRRVSLVRKLTPMEEMIP